MTPSFAHICIAGLLGAVLLAGCQTAPVQPTGSQSVTASQPTPERAESTNMQAARQGAPVALFLADRQIRPGWTPVPAPSGTLYVNPRPFLTRADLRDVKAGGTPEGRGWLALGLNERGARKVADITTGNPNKGLALVIGRTMMPVLSYSQPITNGTLLFDIIDEQNAIAAARAIAGVP